MGFGILAGLMALAVSPALTISSAHADPDARPVMDVAPLPASAAADTPAAYTRATEAPTSAPTPAAKTSIKAKQALGTRKGAGKDAGQPYIEFRSRHAMSYGHTFVVFGRLNGRGEVGEIKPDMVAGLHPAGAGSELWTIGHAVPVPAETGASDGDLEEEYVSNRFRVVLSEEQYAKLVAHIRHKQKTSPMWHAALYNCNLWTGEIAQYLGLQTGFHWLKPADYIQKIKDLNGIGEDGTRSAALQGGG
jgi:hypothetical protein